MAGEAAAAAGAAAGAAAAKMALPAAPTLPARMAFEPAGRDVADRFMAEIRSAAAFSLQAATIAEVVGKRLMRVSAFKPIGADAGPDNAGGEIYQIMIAAHADFILERLGRQHGMPRGFPVLWWPGRKVQMFGFRPKFANDTRQEQADICGTGFRGLGTFKKWSGFLGQLLAFEHGGVPRWAVCSKNSGAGTFADDAARLFEQVLTPAAVDRMVADRVHVCAEMMSANDQGHGASVLREAPVVTSVGVGTTVNIAGRSVIESEPGRFVRFMGFKDTIDFCRANGFPVGNAIVATAVAADALLSKLSDHRDEMTNAMFDKIVDGVAAEYPANLLKMEGTVSHDEVLGDTLEGLVMHAFSVDEGVDVSHDQVVKAIETGQTTVVKFKFPAYTVRTMCIRAALGKTDVEVEGRVIKGKPPVPLSCFDAFCVDWAKHWCVTNVGMARWRLFAWECMLLAADADARARLSDPKVALHIRLAEHVGRHGVRAGIADVISQHSGSTILLASKICVVLPFASDERAMAFQAMLAEHGVASARGNKEPKEGKGRAPGWVSVATMYMRPSKQTQSIYEYPCQLADADMKDWQRKKLANIAPPADRGVIAVTDDENFIATLRASANVVQLGGDDDGKVAPREAELRASVAAMTEELVATIKRRSREQPPVLVLLVGPQAVGKSLACDALVGLGFRVCSADSHMHAGGRPFEPSRLEECHQACQFDALEALMAGVSTVIDNTNMMAAHRTVYTRIARACNSDVIVRALAPELWLEVADPTPTVDALCMRDLRRCLRNGMMPLKRAIVEKAVDIARGDCGKIPTAEWLERVVPQRHRNGLVNDRDALAWRSEALTVAAAAAVASDRLQAHPGIASAVLRKAISRGFDEYHLTLLSPTEWRALDKEVSKDEVAARAEGLVDTLEIGGVGRVEREDGEWALFSVCTWPWVQEWRASLGLPPRDLHVTLAFSDSDIHGVPKTADTCAW